MNSKRHSLTFTLFIFFFVVVCASLGIWQLSRAKQKTALLSAYAKRMHQPPLTAQSHLQIKDLRFHQIQLTGKFDPQKTLLLDNKIVKGQIGYEIYTVFYAEDIKQPILIDRGFIPIQNRQSLPIIAAIPSTVTITGLINNPPRYMALGAMHEKQIYFPLRVEFIDLVKLKPLLGDLFPYVINLSANSPGAIQVEWQITTIGPERHLGYAVQWFALSLTLLLLFICTNRGKPRPSNV